MDLFLLVAGFSALIWLIILLLPWQPWRNHIVLKEELPADPPIDLGDVTVVIPARNEASLVARTLQALASQGPNLHVILVDDNSTDGTAQEARRVQGLDLRILSGKPLGPGWSGKLWALEQGSRQVQTRFTLFIDADIELAPGVVAALLEQQRAGFQMVSIMASLHMGSFWEKLLMPAFIYFFKMLYPFSLANSADRRFSAAAGGCILIETRCLSAIGGLAVIKDAVIDDCALSAQVKKSGFRLWIGQSQQVRSIRPYQGLDEIWNMIARSAYSQLRYSPWILLVCTLGLSLLFLAPVVSLLLGPRPVQIMGLSAWMAMAVSYFSTLHYYRRSFAWAILLPLVGAIYLGMTWSSAIRYWQGERTRWKGRVYQKIQ